MIKAKMCSALFYLLCFFFVFFTTTTFPVEGGVEEKTHYTSAVRTVDSIVENAQRSVTRNSNNNEKEEEEDDINNTIFFTGEGLEGGHDELEEIEEEKGGGGIERNTSENSPPPFSPPFSPSHFRRLVDPITAARSPIPLAVSGECRAGDKFTINSVDDLFKNMKNLECIFAAGVTPEEHQVPLGFSYGYLLSAANTAFWNRFAETAYQGDYVVRTQCNGKYYNIGWMSIGGLKVGTALWTIGTFPYTTKTIGGGGGIGGNGGNGGEIGEYPLGDGRGIIMDFTQDFYKLCPVEGNESNVGLLGFSPFNNSIWPVNNFIDVGRVVGRDRADGGIITLNKAFMITNKGPLTVLIYATKNFDPKVLPDFARDSPHILEVPAGPKGEKIIKYNRVGGESLLSNLNPITALRNERPAQAFNSLLSRFIMEELNFFV